MSQTTEKPSYILLNSIKVGNITVQYARLLNYTAAITKKRVWESITISLQLAAGVIKIGPLGSWAESNVINQTG
jgi:hypothetical protein